MHADTKAVARDVLAALDGATTVEPFTARFAGFDARAAYAVTAELRQRRGARGERTIGRKIGFTNRNIWPEYSVYEPIWGDVYSTTVHVVRPGVLAKISHLPQPRIEPEIVLGLDRDISAGMSIEELESSIGWVAHGFEIVQSIYPDWKCSVADCVADGGLHGALFVGPRRALAPAERIGLADSLASAMITLSRNGAAVDEGKGSNVLDGPIQALRHLADVVSVDPFNPPLRKGELITTGTVTRAFPAAPREKWSTIVQGFDLPGMAVEFY
jgi:2-oxo-3-hexenedioate decarboxylase